MPSHRVQPRRVVHTRGTTWALRIGLLALALALGASWAAGTGTPVLRLVDRSPLTVAGTSFEPREQVQLTVFVDDETTSRSVRAGSRGGFSVRFSALSVGRCDELRIVARGATGNRAVLKLFAPLACQPLSEPEPAAGLA